MGKSFTAYDPVFEICGMKINLSCPEQPDNVNITHSVSEIPTIEENECNIAITIGDKKFKSNRNLLYDRIPFFKSLFNSKMTECASGEINISSNFCGFNIENVESLLEYANTGRLTISEENVQDLMMGAEYFQMESIIEECTRFISRRIRVDNALSILFFIRSMRNSPIENILIIFIDKNVVPISFTSEFLELTVDDLAVFLQRHSINVDIEEQVFDAVTRWIEKDFQERQQHGPRLLKCIRCTLLSESFLIDTVEKTEWVMVNPKCIALVNESKLNKEKNITIKNTSRVCDEATNLIFSIVDRYSNCKKFLGITLEIYNPIENIWKEIPMSQYYRQASKFTCENIAVVDYKVHFLGKPDPQFATCDVFDMVANKWTKIPNMSNSRECMTAEVIDGKIYVAGGIDRNSDDFELSSVEICGPSNESPKWQPSIGMTKRRNDAASCVLNGKIYVIGGRIREEVWNDGEFFDPATKIWNAISPMKQKRYQFTAATLGGHIYVAGGKNGNNKLIEDMERYDPTSDSWTTLRRPNIRRYYPTLVVSCGKLFAVGGYDAVSNYSCVEMYHPETDTWEERASMSKQEVNDKCVVGIISIPASFATPNFMLEKMPIECSGFNQFNLKPSILCAILEYGFDHPSKEQCEFINRAVCGKNVIWGAASGVGKTTAFIISTLQQLDPIDGEVSGLVICRTPEAAAQISKEYERFAKYLPAIKVWNEVQSEKNLMYNCPHIAIGTPGRILALVNDGFFKFHRVKHLVIDNCDEIMSDFCAKDQLLETVEYTPHKKQIMMITSRMDTITHQLCQEFIEEVRKRIQRIFIS